MRKYIIAGLLVWLPLAITVWVLSWLLGLMDGVFQSLLDLSSLLLPASAKETIAQLGRVPGLGIVVVALVLLATGVFVTNMFGQWWVRQYHRVMLRIPIVKSIYNSVKQVSDTLFSGSGNAFREAVLVRWPHGGAWTIALVTGAPGGEVAALLEEEHVSLYVPTTPNPTGGYFIMVPRSQTLPLNMSVDEALKYIISMGVVAPPAGVAAAAAAPAAAPTLPV